MLMDISFWNNLNPDIKFKDTRKQFFGQYLWRMEIHSNCIRVACHDDPEHSIEVLKFQAQNRSNWGGSWRNPNWHFDIKQYDCIDFELFKSIKEIKKTFTTIKSRVEESNLQYYAESENDLKLIAGKLTNTSCIKSITGPRKGTEQLLRRDKIIAPKIPYRYKILIRDGTYNLPLKAQLLNLLESQEDIKITSGLRHNLKRPYPGVWGAFFYANDLGITTMLSIMSPGIIGKIHEVVSN
jgi:hypothetical protein